MTDLLDITIPLAQAFDTAICDLDGVVYAASKPIEAAANSIESASASGLGFVYLTNNASRTPAQVAAKLAGFAVNATANQVVTAAETAVEQMAADLPKHSKVLVVGADGLIEAVKAAHLVPVSRAEQQPAAVIQGWGPDIDWQKLAQAAYAIAGGASYYATNLDKTLPTEQGLAPGNGSLVAALVSATGVEPKASGKPNPSVFHLAARRAQAKNPLVIGDRLDTDLAGARAAGYPGLMVLTGVSTLAQVCLTPPAWRPSLLGSNLGALLETHPAPVFNDQRWLLTDSAAWFDPANQSVQVKVGSNLDHAIRCLVQASWQAVDNGAQLVTSDLPQRWW